MRPTFTTEIGQMRAEEMRLRAERRHVARKAMAARPQDTEDTIVVAERRRPFTLRRIFAFATGVFGLMTVMATSALAMPIGPGSGGGALEGLAPLAPEPVSQVTAAPFDMTALIVAAVLVAALAGALYAAFARRGNFRLA